MRMIRFTSILPIAALLAMVSSASAQQGMPGEVTWDLQKMRGRTDCTRNLSCDFTFNSENGWNAGALAQSTSTKDCAQVAIETTDGGRYAVRTHLPELGARTIGELEAALDQRLQSEDAFLLKTWVGKSLILLPRNIVAMEAGRCH